MSEQNPTAAERREAAAEARTEHQTAAERREAAATEHKTTSVAEHKDTKSTAHGKLAPAGASGDPAVQKALADLYTAQQNRRSLDVEEADVKAADEAVKVAEKNLADLGYE